MPTVQDQIDHLKTYDPQMPCAMHLWLPDDVTGRALEHGNKVTAEQAAEVLDDMESGCDSSTGLNWDVLDCCIDELGDLPKATCKDMEDGGQCNEECPDCKAYRTEATPEEQKAAEECADVCQNEKCLNDDCNQCRMGKILFGDLATYRKEGAIKDHRQGMGADEVELQVKRP
jgi:hypothetical protein